MDSNHVVTGSIVNLDTGEASEIKQVLFPNDSTLMCFIKVTGIEIDDETDDFCEIVATGMGLDSYGVAFKIQLVYQPETVQDKDGVLAGVQANRYYSASGRFSHLGEDGIVLFDPDCRALSDGDAEEIAQVFRVNEMIADGRPE